MPLEVVCVGVVTIDTIAVVDRVPGPDGRVVAAPFTVAGGGPAATAAVALARLGVPVGFCGVVGDDEDGERARALLDDAGVDTHWLTTRPGTATASSVVVVTRTTGERMIITSPSAPPDPASVPTHAARWLHVDQTGYGSVRAAIADAPAHRRAEVMVSVDGGNPIAGLDLRGVELYAPSVSALRAVFPVSPTDSDGDGGDVAAAMRAAAAAGARQVVATDGAHGSHVLVDGAARLVPPVAVPTLSSSGSTIGAGDVFHGALLAGLVEGRPLTDAAAWANAVAALSCRALDGQSGIPDAAEARQFLGTHPGETHGPADPGRPTSTESTTNTRCTTMSARRSEHDPAGTSARTENHVW
ncbi:carbohydrate kinase family protein [Plantactinospora endophytica]|uniref:Ribokinase n=1 Tax=Plantactinospora endophytica TaxID=673535 RepID=A0ABQ4DZE4_9ACTN|nr:PfkB family carbohydrate kinase [Plantactinospora endophytica]GIG87820.1 ribokinase [Plantactinospora endophytica]